MVLYERFPALSEDKHLYAWITIQMRLGLVSNTLEAYARALTEFFALCQSICVSPIDVTQEHISLYVDELSTRIVTKGGRTQIGLSNATMQQRLVAVRLYYDYLQEIKIRENNPVRRGVYTPGKAFGGNRRGILPHYQKLPWIPNEKQWGDIILAAHDEPLRNRFMLALAYDAGLRRSEICALSVEDIDPSHRLISLPAEICKGKRARVVPYSEDTNLLYMSYLSKRRELSRNKGFLFLSESRRNKAQPISKWTWSKVIRNVAYRAGVPQFSTHTLRHLCLTDLARAGWDIHEIAAFAGHKSVNTTLMYIHLSGRDLLKKMAKSVDSIHAWRSQMMQEKLM